MDIEILQGSIQKDHIHMYLSVPPKHSPSEVMKKLKGKSSEILFKKFPSLKKKYWGQHLWARGYFVSTGGVNDDVIKKYNADQHEKEITLRQLRLWDD